MEDLLNYLKYKTLCEVPVEIVDKFCIEPTLQGKAESGDADAQYELGACYDKGRKGFSQDYAEAVKWYEKAAQQGHVRAQHCLGWFYAHGEGVKKDYAEAVKWYRKSAEQGYAEGQYHLGLCYKNGIGVEKDIVEATEWLKEADSQGHRFAKSEYNSLFNFWNSRLLRRNGFEKL